VQWKNRDRIEVPVGKRVVFRIHLEGAGIGPKLYGYTFAAAN
jgi:hypothetical protein